MDTKRICRICRGNKFKTVINFGQSPLVNSLLDKGDLVKKERTYPLVVEQCQNCWLVQIVDPVDAHKIYRTQDYLYFSSDMPLLAEYFAVYANEIKEKYIHDPTDFIVEIGSNDGIFLKNFNGHEVLGVDPSTNVVVKALHRGIPTVSDFFSERLAKNIVKYWTKAKIISGSNCIAHLADLHDLMRGVNALLDEDGVFTVECNYWGGMMKNKNYSLIYHDHFSYFSLAVWVNFLRQYDFDVFDAYVTPAQGGSLRLFACRKGKYEVTTRRDEILVEEDMTRLNSAATADKYRREVLEAAERLGSLVEKLVKKGHLIAGYGAAAKGLSVLQLAKITGKQVRFFIDDSPAKQGKFTPITHIPVYSRSYPDIPDFFLITAPNYEKVIVEKEKDFLAQGGRFITVDGRIVEKSH